MSCLVSLNLSSWPLLLTNAGANCEMCRSNFYSNCCADLSFTASADCALSPRKPVKVIAIFASMRMKVLQGIEVTTRGHCMFNPVPGVHSKIGIPSVWRRGHMAAGTKPRKAKAEFLEYCTGPWVAGWPGSFEDPCNWFADMKSGHRI
jgi:hypothetical protein